MQRRGDLDEEAAGSIDLCDFCYLPDKRKVLFQNDIVYALPPLGSFVEGYVLLVSQSHDDCFADIMNQDIVESKKTVRETVEKVYGNCIFFEHGNVGNCFTRGNCKIDFHAHMHCVPTDKDISDRIAEDYNEFELNNIYELTEYKDRFPHYMYFENSSGKKYFYSIETSVESQFLRKRTCEAIGLDPMYANWREFEFRQNMKQTATVLSDNFQE
jgi:diadenosine tetraphosphate (Ap4A) HIT family hydrolase